MATKQISVLTALITVLTGPDRSAAEVATGVIQALYTEPVTNDTTAGLKRGKGWWRLSEDGVTQDSPQIMDTYTYLYNLEKAEIVLGGVFVTNEEYATATDLYVDALKGLQQELSSFSIADVQGQHVASEIVVGLKERYKEVIADVAERKTNWKNHLMARLTPTTSPSGTNLNDLTAINLSEFEKEKIREIDKKIKKNGDKLDESSYNVLAPDDRQILLLSVRRTSVRDNSTLTIAQAGEISTWLSNEGKNWNAKYEPS